jgi:hypothetical protein
MISTKINRIYRQKIVSNLTLNEIEKLIDVEDIAYSADYGLKVAKDVRLVFSMN